MHPHLEEELDFAISAPHDRFDGFCRGDLCRDYEDDMIAMWEAASEQ